MAIVFARTKRRVDELSEALSKRGYSAEGIHGDLTQSKREGVVEELLADNDSVTLLSAALKIITKEPETVEVRLTEAAPMRGRSMGNARPQQRNYNRDGHGQKVDSWARGAKRDVRGGGAGATAQRGRDNKRKG